VTGAPAATANEFAAPALADVTLHKGDLKPPEPACVAGLGLRRNTSRREAERVALSAADGYPITGMRYANAGPTRAHLIVAGATGVPQRFYRRFAEFAAAAGYSTMTLDYRGVGLSAPTTLKGFRMDYFDWGRLDLAAAVDAMSSPDVPLYIVAHSYGGHAFSVLPKSRTSGRVLRLRYRGGLARLDAATRTHQGVGHVACPRPPADQVEGLFVVESATHGGRLAIGFLSAMEALVSLSQLFLW
jgi:Serine aminopeptidase, S33